MAKCAGQGTGEGEGEGGGRGGRGGEGGGEGRIEKARNGGTGEVGEGGAGGGREGAAGEREEGERTKGGGPREGAIGSCCGVLHSSERLGDHSDATATTKEAATAAEIDPFDLIVSAETIYATPQIEKISDVLRATLRRPSGIALLAAKRFYFGTGGGVEPFLEHLRGSEGERGVGGRGKEGGKEGDGGTAPEKKKKIKGEEQESVWRLRGRVIRSVEDGRSNIRDIILVQWER